MRHFAFFLFCLSVSSHLWAQGKNYDLKPEEIKFRYQPNDDAGVPCQHKKHREPWDWKVVCEKGYYKKEFLVHLLMRKYRRSGTDSLEILYWLTNRKPNNKRPNDIPEFTGTTLMLDFNEGLMEQRIRMGQQVDNDFASLVLVFKPKKQNLQRELHIPNQSSR